ncbi:YraN family protein [Paenibacillus humicola]|uniref:YraN family protein n=1 Tax=Paenibacillus humicola TaxID=3110540 RepID=UPI00237A459D|nr:YraN family protein [Paenibacillus humicola]
MSGGFGKPPGKPRDLDASLRLSRRREVGRIGEEAAAERLRQGGYEILHRNWRCRFGELDIVARRGETVIVAEVRTRTSGGRFGTASESVDFRKQRRVRTLAEIYIQQHNLQGVPVRFDAIVLSLDKHSGQIIEYRHLEGAF